MSFARIPQAAVDRQFTDRWSGRALSSEPIPPEAIKSLFEAARWAPSCFNEQPWLFVYADSERDLSRLRPLLVEKNRIWADRAPLLMVILSRREFGKNGKANRHAGFDAGAAWMSLALQAHSLGLSAHAMGGFDEIATYQALGISPDRFTALAMVAVGKRADATILPPELQAIEKPNGRKDAARVAVTVAGLAAHLAAGESP